MSASPQIFKAIREHDDNADNPVRSAAVILRKTIVTFLRNEQPFPWDTKTIQSVPDDNTNLMDVLDVLTP